MVVVRRITANILILKRSRDTGFIKRTLNTPSRKRHLTIGNAGKRDSDKVAVIKID